ncbi:MAG: PD-(D/E)XK nuclease family protein [archaeon]
MVRVESPSSINTYKQCPRKYYYHYIEELPSSPSIHLIRGKIVHFVLENFFDIDNNIKTEDDLQLHLMFLLEKTWAENQSEFMELDLDENKIKSYYNESKDMLNSWFSRFRRNLQANMEKGTTFHQAFKDMTPRREEEFSSEKHNVRGFIDAIYESNGNAIILDYKTSKKMELTPEYRLQLGIYALMYHEKNGVLPAIVGIDFLRYPELLVQVDEQLVEDAKREVDWMHTKTVSTNLEDYPQKPSPLCKWSNGQCDYYKECFGNL